MNTHFPEVGTIFKQKHTDYIYIIHDIKIVDCHTTIISAYNYNGYNATFGYDDIKEYEYEYLCHCTQADIALDTKNDIHHSTINGIKCSLAFLEKLLLVLNTKSFTKDKRNSFRIIEKRYSHGSFFLIEQLTKQHTWEELKDNLYTVKFNNSNLFRTKDEALDFLDNYLSWLKSVGEKPEIIIHNVYEL